MKNTVIFALVLLYVAFSPLNAVCSDIIAHVYAKGGSGQQAFEVWRGDTALDEVQSGMGIARGDVVRPLTSAELVVKFVNPQCPDMRIAEATPVLGCDAVEEKSESFSFLRNIYDFFIKQSVQKSEELVSTPTMTLRGHHSCGCIPGALIGLTEVPFDGSTVLPSTPLAFCVPGGGYLCDKTATLEIKDSSGNLIYSGEIRVGGATAIDVELSAGETYAWSVTSGPGNVKGPHHFTILDEERAETISDTLRSLDNDPSEMNTELMKALYLIALSDNSPEMNFYSTSLEIIRKLDEAVLSDEEKLLRKYLIRRIEENKDTDI